MIIKVGIQTLFMMNLETFVLRLEVQVNIFYCMHNQLRF